MYPEKRKNRIMTNINTLFTILLLSLLYGCNFKEKKEDRTFYRAINGKDTALLSLSINKNRFYGQYEIIYGKMGKDSGDVRGEIIGDSLRGVYNYVSYGGSWKKVPIAFLRKNNTLLLGSGVASSLLGMPIYLPEVPIDYNNSAFIFEEINKSVEK